MNKYVFPMAPNSIGTFGAGSAVTHLTAVDGEQFAVEVFFFQEGGGRGEQDDGDVNFTFRLFHRGGSDGNNPPAKLFQGMPPLPWATYTSTEAEPQDAVGDVMDQMRKSIGEDTDYTKGIKGLNLDLLGYNPWNGAKARPTCVLEYITD